jgi:hypothetical protein
MQISSVFRITEIAELLRIKGFASGRVLGSRQQCRVTKDKHGIQAKRKVLQPLLFF